MILRINHKGLVQVAFGAVAGFVVAVVVDALRARPGNASDAHRWYWPTMIGIGAGFVIVGIVDFAQRIAKGRQRGDSTGALFFADEGGSVSSMPMWIAAFGMLAFVSALFVAVFAV